MQFGISLSRLKVTQSISNIFNYSTLGLISSPSIELTNTVKHSIEEHWRGKLGDDTYIHNNEKEKMYILSMFPYPSGFLHMGHVRVYTISDAIARFYRMNGQNVLHPMGWDAFGLPAENAAIQRNIPAKIWTEQNITHMKKQLNLLACSFDWSRELSTCTPKYYKWTQFLFLKLFKEGLAYQSEAIVNWDPIDQTVLADEQVDHDGKSWRSGAKVEKKLLNQWFIKTTKFAKSLYDGLSESNLEDWRDIIKIQQHWIGECDGFAFNLNFENSNKKLFVWTKTPEDFIDSSFIVLKSNHILNTIENLEVLNPFSLKYSKLKIIFSDDTDFPINCDSKLGTPYCSETDKKLADLNKFEYSLAVPDENQRNEILTKANELNIGGYPVSSKLKDWLISRQRYWGTPIPIVHCETCGAVPVDEKDLPVVLPEVYGKNENWTKTECPKCGQKAKRELDTMDTFVDSSWYFLRFLDPQNDSEIFDKKLSKDMPVDIYIGGKEHAALHLYYARFINYFLYSIGLVPQPEPFQRLLVQGMVMGRSFRVKGSGKYITESEVDIINEKKNKALEKSTGDHVVMSWEKMSKSKLNGVDPEDVIKEYGCDATRLIILADVAPTSHRNWSPATFPGILNWQKRLWLTLNEFKTARKSIDSKNDFDTTSTEFIENNYKMYDARNYYLKGVTFNFKYSHQLSVAISKMQGLTNSIRRAPEYILQYSGEYEKALATQIIMLAPMAPHFASELWSIFLSVPNRINIKSSVLINWNKNVLEQSWPEIDMNYEFDLTIKINGHENSICKIPLYKLQCLTQKDYEDIAFKVESVKSYIANKNIRNINLTTYSCYDSTLNILLEKAEKKT